MTEMRSIPGGVPVEDFGYRPAPDGLRANMIFSADGAAAFAGRAGPLSCPADFQLLLALRAYADVVLVGAGTARAEGYGPVRLRPQHLAQRRQLGLGDTPPPIAVVSRSGDLPDSLFGSRTPILVTSARGARERSETRCDVLVAGDDEVDVPAAVAQLRERGMTRVLCEGGPTLLDQLVAADLVDELCVTMAPRLAGAQPVGHGPGAPTSPTPLRLGRLLVDPDGYLFLTYQR
ncbi:pyrimidine reductase family protein [Mycolicibacterium iranicum]